MNHLWSSFKTVLQVVILMLILTQWVKYLRMFGVLMQVLCTHQQCMADDSLINGGRRLILMNVTKISSLQTMSSYLAAKAALTQGSLIIPTSGLSYLDVKMLNSIQSSKQHTENQSCLKGQ